jgi:hypothetical protein
MDDDIRRIAESPAGKRNRALRSRVWGRGMKAAHARHNAAVEREYKRHNARLRALSARLQAEVDAAQDAADRIERDFFNAELAKLSSASPSPSNTGEQK